MEFFEYDDDDDESAGVTWIMGIPYTGGYRDFAAVLAEHLTYPNVPLNLNRTIPARRCQ